MRRILSFLILAGLIYISWPIVSGMKSTEEIGDLKQELHLLTANHDFSNTIETFRDGINQIISQLNSTKAELNKSNQTDLVEKPELEVPASQTFSVHNIEIGDSKAEVEKLLGEPKRISANDYGTQWHTYHKNYQNFLMVSYSKEKKVNGLYTNQGLISAKNGIKYGSDKKAVRERMGAPLNQIKKENVYYQFQKERDYDVYLKDGSYITIFYDKHQDNTVTAIQIISEQLELGKQGFYSKASTSLKEGFEYQLFDLTNASRAVHGLPLLSWDDRVKETARKHSKDMAEHEYFSHTNLNGESPFDRMAKDDIVFALAGENLAYGQFSSIFAHEGLMNSEGHRENILKHDFEQLGIGVAFGSKFEPYFTENFYTKRM